MSQDDKLPTSLEDAFNQGYQNNVPVIAGNKPIGNVTYPTQTDEAKPREPIQTVEGGSKIIIPGKPDLLTGVTVNKYRKDLEEQYTMFYKERVRNPALPADPFELPPNSNVPSYFDIVKVPIPMSKNDSVRINHEFNLNQLRMSGFYRFIDFKDCSPIPTNNPNIFFIPGVSDVDSTKQSHNGYAIVSDHFLMIAMKDRLLKARQDAIDRFNQKGQTVKDESRAIQEEAHGGQKSSTFNAYFEIPEVSIEQFLAEGDPITREERRQG